MNGRTNQKEEKRVKFVVGSLSVVSVGGRSAEGKGKGVGNYSNAPFQRIH